MNYLKNLGKSFIISMIIFILSLFLVTLLNYFNIINDSILNILTYIIPFISFFIGAFILGTKSNIKGFLEGLKFSLIFILLFVLINLLLKNKFNLGSIIFYLIIIISSVTGSILGINKK